MLATKKNLVKDAAGPPSEGFAGLLRKVLMPAVIAAGALNFGLAYRDYRQVRVKAARLESRVEEVRERNRRMEELTRKLTRDPATLERWLRERNRLLQGEEVVAPK